MSFFRRRPKPQTPAEQVRSSSEPPEWASGVASALGVVPPSIVTAVETRQLPPAVAACVDGGPDRSGPDWIDVADAVDDLTRTGAVLTGPVYAMGAYAHLDACFTMVDETAERAARAADLLALAVAHGVASEELSGLHRWAESLAESGAEQAEEAAERATWDPATLHGRDLRDRAFDLTDSPLPDDLRAGAELYGRVAEESVGDADAVLEARLRQHLARYRAGDRNQALPQLTKLAEESTTLSGPDYLLDGVRATLVVDAAEHGGPDAALAAWYRARRQSARFPLPGIPEHMVDELARRGVPLVMRELADVLQARDLSSKATREALAVARGAAAT